MAQAVLLGSNRGGSVREAVRVWTEAGLILFIRDCWDLQSTSPAQTSFLPERTPRFRNTVRHP